MAALMTSLGIDRMSPEEQLQLVGELLDTLNEPAAPPLTEPQRRELDRRLALLDAGQTGLHPWDEVEARVLATISPGVRKASPTGYSPSPLRG